MLQPASMDCSSATHWMPPVSRVRSCCSAQGLGTPFLPNSCKYSHASYARDEHMHPASCC
jgi:hypothetical protein